MIAVNPMLSARPPRAQRSIPNHWTPEQARSFLDLMEGDRTYPAWAFLLGSGLRIGELVSLRWGNVDLGRRVVHVVEFVSTLGYEASCLTRRSAWPNSRASTTAHMHFQNIHPEALRRLDRLDREIATAAWEMDVDRQSLDGIPAQYPELPPVGRGLHRDARVLERTIELDRGFGLEL